MAQLHMRTRRLTVGLLALLIAGQMHAYPSPIDEAPADDDIEAFAELSLEELGTIEVVSLTGIEQEWFDTPAAIYVITNDEIRRSGHRSIAEALRLAPGVFVGQTESHSWSIGMRGFNGSLANKTLVLIDGRAVYDPLFGGTFWTIQDVLLEDVDRIEVIRGPGPTLWGSNAVNGVINVITKSAEETQGVFVQGGGGTLDRGFGSIRYGFQLSDSSWLRVYGKWSERDHFVDAAGNSTHEDWDLAIGGFRFDHEGDDNFSFTLQGDVYYTDRIGELTPNAPVPGMSSVFVTDLRDVYARGGNLRMRMGQDHGDHGWSVQTYYDHRERLTNIEFEVQRDTFDVDWRHYFSIGDSHQIMWGLGTRHIRDRTKDGYQLLFRPESRTLETYSAFIQDTITLVPDRLFAMIGSKFEHNTYTDFEVQPSARIWWTPDDKNTLWASVSRSVRVPSRSETDGMIVFRYMDAGVLGGGAPTGVIVPLGVAGTPGLEAEELTSYEAGYRVRPTDELTIDIAAFYNDYNNLIYVPSIFEPFNNDGFGETYGGEITASWRVADNWELKGSYSFVDVLIHGPVLAADEGNTPHHLLKLQSYLDITDDLEFNSTLAYTDSVPSRSVDAYWRLDLGLTWRPSANVEISIWGQNLLDSQHPEFTSGAEVPRSFYVMGSLRF